jgi:hypothetical protein
VDLTGGAAEERVEQLRKSEQREATANAASARSKRLAEASAVAVEVARNEVSLVQSASRGDEAIATAEVWPRSSAVQMTGRSHGGRRC